MNPWKQKNEVLLFRRTYQHHDSTIFGDGISMSSEENNSTQIYSIQIMWNSLRNSKNAKRNEI